MVTTTRTVPTATRRSERKMGAEEEGDHHIVFHSVNKKGQGVPRYKKFTKRQLAELASGTTAADVIPEGTNAGPGSVDAMMEFVPPLESVPEADFVKSGSLRSGRDFKGNAGL